MNTNGHHPNGNGAGNPQNNGGSSGSGAAMPPMPYVFRDLTEPQRQQLTRWLVDEQLSYRVVCEKLLSLYGVETSEQSVSKFWKRVCVPIILERGKAARRAADMVEPLVLTIHLVLKRGGKVIAASALDGIGVYDDGSGGIPPNRKERGKSA